MFPRVFSGDVLPLCNFPLCAVVFVIKKKKSSPEDMFPSILEKGETQGREKEIDWLPPVYTPIRVPMGNLGMCLNQEVDPQRFGSLETPQPTESPGQGDSCF